MEKKKTWHILGMKIQTASRNLTAFSHLAGNSFGYRPSWR